MRRDVVAMGASMGGVEAFTHVLAQVPPDFPAALLLVLHMGAGAPSQLANILGDAARIPVTWAQSGDSVVPGHAYIAPPDHHLLVGPTGLVLDTGARENFSRPSINRTFRSVAVHYGSRAIGVLMTGLLSDGVDGLRAIMRVGGVTIAQAPLDAQAPELPQAAIDAGVVDRQLALRQIVPALLALVHEDAAGAAIPEDLIAEAAMDLGVPPDARRMPAVGDQTTVRCPDCGGPMWAAGDERFRTFRCYLGHAHSTRDLLAGESIEVERALWTAVRALHDRASTLEILAADSRRIGNQLAAEQFDQRARETRNQADLAREFLLTIQHVRVGADG